MKLNILTTAAILAITGAFMTQSAKAQFTTSQGAPTGDLVLSISSTGTGSATNYEIDLGSFTLYTGTSTVNIANINSDLTSVYGSNWDTSGNITFAILGNVVGSTINGVTSGSLLVSDTSTTALGTVGNTTIGTDANTAGKIYTPVLDTTNVPVAGSTANSEEVSTASGYSFAKVSLTDGFAAAGISAPITSDLYLDTEKKNGSFGNTISTVNTTPFFITSTGEVTYGAQVVVPEPSTYALGLVGLVVIVVAMKRRQSISKV